MNCPREEEEEDSLGTPPSNPITGLLPEAEPRERLLGQRAGGLTAPEGPSHDWSNQQARVVGLEATVFAIPGLCH